MKCLVKCLQILGPWLLAMALFGAMLATCRASAQGDDVGLMLAKVAVNEGGFESLADADAIAAISIRQARLRSIPLGTYLRTRFLRALAPAERRRNRPWIASLSRVAGPPHGWPASSQPWSARSAQWGTLLHRMDHVVAGDIRVSCNAHTWGSAVYDKDAIERILANGGRVVDCGPTKNVYLRFGAR